MSGSFIEHRLPVKVHIQILWEGNLSGKKNMSANVWFFGASETWCGFFRQNTTGGRMRIFTSKASTKNHAPFPQLWNWLSRQLHWLPLWLHLVGKHQSTKDRIAFWMQHDVSNTQSAKGERTGVRTGLTLSQQAGSLCPHSSVIKSPSSGSSSHVLISGEHTSSQAPHC